MWIYILFGIISVLLLFFVSWHFQLRKDVAKMTEITQNIHKGNYNLRFRLITTRKDMAALSSELNRMTDDFQNNLMRTKFLEEERQRMISNISHDFRTPLTSMLGYIEVLLEDKNLSKDDTEEYLKIAFTKGNDLFSLMKEFIEFARLEEVGEQLPTKKIELNETAQAALLDFYPEFMRLEIEPKIDMPDHSVFATGNTEALGRVFHNLISNALKYGAEGNEIGVTIREEIDLVWVDVWDKGKGIPAANLPFVFERLYTSESSRNPALRGSGLGLAIAKNLIEKQGGSISVTSKAHEKTVFSFCLPIYQ